MPATLASLRREDHGIAESNRKLNVKPDEENAARRLCKDADLLAAVQTEDCFSEDLGPSCVCLVWCAQSRA